MKKTFPNQFPNPPVRNEAVVKFPPTGIAPSITPFGQPAFRQGYQASIVEFHHLGKNASGSSFKWEMQKFAFRIFVNRNDEADEISADIEKERGRHQLGIAHIIILVLVQGLEPKPVSDRILLIIIS